MPRRSATAHRSAFALPPAREEGAASGVISRRGAHPRGAGGGAREGNGLVVGDNRAGAARQQKGRRRSPLSSVASAADLLLSGPS
mmetsp:Transcript_26211/g.77530  ORF Transcript_26211/g.77530 Transcript_26211/m.77530 type:complete len:85 (+) Transcript_26211:121-375(+)